MKHRNFLAFLIIIALNFSTTHASDGGGEGAASTSEITSTNAVQGVPFGLSIKVVPALFWGAFGVQVEYPVAEKLSVGMMVMAKKSDSKGYTIYPEDYQKAGFAVDLIAKYYFVGTAPEGLYGLADLSYNSMLFYDGNTRPYTLHNRWKEFEGYRIPNSIKSPKPFNAAIGVGYQLVIIPQHIIADVYMALSGNFDDNNSVFIQLYMAPSLGFMF